MSRTVLVIEDEPNIAEALTFILQRDGWRVLTHANGADAMEAVTRVAPDAVILDVMLPNRNGYDILRDLRTREATRALPVLILTAKGQARDRELAEDAGASRFMTKPFANDEITCMLRGMVGA